MRSLLIFLAVLCSTSQAETRLSWPECVKMAAEKNPALLAAQQDLRSAQAQVGESRSGYFPSLAASLGGANEHGSGVVGNGRGYNATLTLSQNLFTGLSDRAKVRQSEANVKASEAALQIAKAQLSYNLKTQFESVRYAEDSLALAKDIIKRREDNLKLVRLRFEGGVENKGSLLLSEAYLEDAKYGQLQAQDAMTVALVGLKNILGWDSAGTLGVSGEVPLRDPDTHIDFRQLATETPDELQAVAKERSADAGVTAARSGFFPKLDFSGLTEKRGDQFFPEGDHWKIGLTLTIPLFNGGHDYYAVRSAGAGWKSAMLNLQNADEATLTKLKTAYTGYVEAVAKLKVDESYRKAAMLRAEIARKKYNNGLMTFDDWDLIENDLIAREKSYLQSVKARVLAEAAWEQALGKGAIP